MDVHSPRGIERVTTSLDRFFEHYYMRRPVNATFTGVHDFDDRLPDWSPAGIDALNGEMREIASMLEREFPAPPSPREYAERPDLLDAQLARDFLSIQLAENESGHGPRGNPALWTGEAVFSIVSLMIRDFAPVEQRVASSIARLSAIPAFLAHATETMANRPIPSAWKAKAVRECEGGKILFTRGIERWIADAKISDSSANDLRQAASAAFGAAAAFADWLRSTPVGPDDAARAGPELFDLLLMRGHHCSRSRNDLLADAKSRFASERAKLNEMAEAMAGSWPAAQEQILSDHPPAEDYFDAFERIWNEARSVALARDVVTWPDWPIRYVPYPEYTSEVAPYLYYLHYRSPAPFDPYRVHDYVVPGLHRASDDSVMRPWNYSVMKLNHVVHHGGIGHHVQNWHAYNRAPSRVAKIAAVDCANRLAMFSAGTMAEGWACYVTGLMDELGFLTPLEQIADQHTRVRGLARAIVDIELHQRSMTLEDAVRFYQQEVGMSGDAARGEAVKNSMFPCAAIMYWLGTQGILDLRASLAKRAGAEWSLKQFHDDLLGCGSIPVALAAQILA